MDFTREPIIETVITPREGCKLVIRSSRGNGQEDYFVDAVEVVSFGHSFFFRSLERPKSFLVPVSDYEILELKETRMVLKNVTMEKSVKKIGGSNAKEEDMTLIESRPAPEREPKKRGKSRRGRRGRDREKQPLAEEKKRDKSSEEKKVGEKQIAKSEEAIVDENPLAKEDQAFENAPSFISKLFPPPPTLIKESLSKYNPVEEEESSSSEKMGHEETLFEDPPPLDVDNKNESDS